MSKYQEAVRDYRRYLCSDPPPPDISSVQEELDTWVDMRRNEAKKQAQAQQAAAARAKAEAFAKSQAQQQRASQQSYGGGPGYQNYARGSSRGGQKPYPFDNDDEDDCWSDYDPEDTPFYQNQFKPKVSAEIIVSFRIFFSIHKIK